MSDGQILLSLVAADLVLVVAAMIFIYWVDRNE
jgi:hypothetical protein